MPYQHKYRSLIILWIGLNLPFNVRDTLYIILGDELLPPKWYSTTSFSPWATSVASEHGLTAKAGMLLKESLVSLKCTYPSGTSG